LFEQLNEKRREWIRNNRRME